MLMVGLTGGIGAGKSAVAARLAALGALVIDSDALAHEIVRPGTDALAEVVGAFGVGLLTASGELDRPAMGRLVFDDDARRHQLEQIIHPRLRARAAQIIAAAPDDAIVVNDVPLLVEANLAANYDLVLVVLASEAIRVERLARDRGMSAAQARSRIAVQATDEQRRAVADVVIVNEGTIDELRAAVDDVWRSQVMPRAQSQVMPRAQQRATRDGR